ncbi:MAG: FtsW/RodA/SpoVE family cell cycle protein [Bacteroidales bacterium]|nr:FtsW/RodA/SpoVE family cell cycle protein [Bacteroidales bacterium]MBP5683350.1 FtsW/RodA/SpoVE family cell cycle protein [Bacteroidales bacterium]
MGKLKSVIKGDRTIWVLMLFLAVVGWLEVMSCTTLMAYKLHEGNTSYYPLKHFACLLVGFGMMFIFSWISYKKFVKWADILLWASVGLLFFTLVSGVATNDAKRWFTIPLIGMTIQTSDVAKFALVVYLSKKLALAQVEPEKKWNCFIMCIVAIVAVCLLVLPANFSTAVLIGGACLWMLILGNFPKKWILGLIAIGIVLLVLFVAVVKIGHFHSRVDTWISRVETYFSSDSEQTKDFQTQQSLVAIGLGGLQGVGFGSGIQNNSLPHSYSDFIFASIAHELGILGVIGVIGLYMILFYRCVMIVKRTETLFPALLVMGFLTNIMLQTLANILVSIDFMPVTGQPLPFMSMGGSAILTTGMSLGVILNISRYTGDKETVSEIEQDEKEIDEVVDYPFMAG